MDVPHSDLPNGSGLFFGYINTAESFTNVEFENTVGDSDAFGFDDFTIGTIEQIIPEPASMSILAVTALFMARRVRSNLSA